MTEQGKRNIQASIFAVLWICLCIFMFIEIHEKNHEPNPTIQYINDTCRVIARDEYTQIGKYFLIQRFKDTTYYAELNGLNWEPMSRPRYGDSLYHAHKINDTLVFKFINKSRFFETHTFYR